MGRHLILCDAVDSGKSTAVLALAMRLIAEGRSVAGFVTPPFRLGGRKAGHDFVAIEGSRASPPIPFTREEAFEGSFFWRRYHFSRAAFQSAARIPLDAELFLLDEIGPLELEEGRGFAAIARIAYRDCPGTLTVVRSGLEEALRSLAPETPFMPVTSAEIMAPGWQP